MRFKLWLMLAVAVVVGGAIAHEALAGGDGTQTAKRPALTAGQKAARTKLAETAAFLKANHLSCGCQHHFAPVKAAAKP